MAASIKKLSNIFKTQLCSHNACVNSVFLREASKKGSGASRNEKGRVRGKHRGWKKLPGDYVEKGMIIFRQFGLRVYPGENVGCGRDMTLFALERGKVEMTAEKLSPYPRSPLYNAVQQGRSVYKLFYHVVPEPQEQKFKLVSQV